MFPHVIEKKSSMKFACPPDMYVDRSGITAIPSISILLYRILYLRIFLIADF